ncbi:hypothetical protein ACFL6Q_05485 [Candidatus Neomarinimicrobiota bacterium]
MLWAQLDSPFRPDFIDEQQFTSEELSALQSYLDNPLDLNTATFQDLWFMDDSLAAIILNARQASPYLNWQDLAQRTQLPKSMIQELALVFYLRPEQHFRGDWSTRILTSGNDERIRSRLNVSRSFWFAQGTLQRDPEEYDLTDLSAFSVGFMRGATRLIIGSQRLDWGLGLILAKVYSPRRGTSLLRSIVDIMGIKPGYSNITTGAMRGISLAVQLGQLQFFTGTGFHETDVTLTPDGSSRIIPNRTHSRPSSHQYELLPWVGASTSLKQTKLGAFIGEQHLMPTDTLPGARKRVHSLVLAQNYIAQIGTWRLRHEEAWQTRVYKETPREQIRASQTRLIFQSQADSSGGRVHVALIYRAYPQAWIPIRGQLFGRHVSNGNERGLYLGWEWIRNPINLTGHLDCFQQIVSTTSFWPQRGWESGIGASLKAKSWRTRLSYRYEEEEVNISSENSDGLIINTRVGIVTHHTRVAYTGNLGLRLSVRIYAALTRDQNENGFASGNAIGSTLRYQSRATITMAAGVHLFGTDGWDQRMVIYETGLPGEFNMRPLSGSGVRIHGFISMPMETGTISVRAAKEWKDVPVEEATATSSLQLGIQIDIAL